MSRGDARIRLLLQVLDQAFVAKGWQGATLRGAVRGLTHRQALWRPRTGRHNVWELVLHTAYWKHVVRQRVAGGVARPKRFRAGRATSRACRSAATPRPGARTSPCSSASTSCWSAVRDLPPSRLGARVGKSRWVVAEQIFGIAAHDLYHTGQIQLLKAMQRERSG